MPKTIEQFVEELGKETETMNDADAREFLESLKDEIETMLDMIPEDDESGEDADDGQGPDTAS